MRTKLPPMASVACPPVPTLTSSPSSNCSPWASWLETPARTIVVPTATSALACGGWTGKSTVLPYSMVPIAIDAASPTATQRGGRRRVGIRHRTDGCSAAT